MNVECIVGRFSSSRIKTPSRRWKELHWVLVLLNLPDVAPHDVPDTNWITSKTWIRPVSWQRQLILNCFRIYIENKKEEKRATTFNTEFRNGVFFRNGGSTNQNAEFDAKGIKIISEFKEEIGNIIFVVAFADMIDEAVDAEVEVVSCFVGSIA